MKKRMLLLLMIAALAALLLCACEKAPEQPTTTEPVATEPPVEHVTLVVTEDTISQLEQYPQLKSADLTGSTCYAAIMQYKEAHPKVDVTYNVQLGTLTVAHNETALVLDPGVCDYATLAENLAYLPAVETVSMPRTTYTAQEIEALEGLYPDVAWDYTVILLGQEVTNETTSLNLSVLEADRVAEVAGKVGLFPNVTTVELMDSYGNSNLTKEDVKTLQDAAPNAVFHYTFELFGKTVSTTDERIEYVKQDIGNEGEEELRSALAILQGCSYFLLEDCGFDNEVLAAVREDFREGPKVVWRVYFGKTNRYTYLTDTDTIRAVYNVTDDTCGNMKYCEDVKYMDLGHNEYLTDITFISYMKDIEIVILSGSPITDLTPFTDHKKLEFLELAYCGHIKDVSALAGCESLAHVNLSFTKVEDISPLYELPLQQLCAVKSRIPWSSWEDIMELHPDCSVRYDGNQPYGTGWRYKKSGAYTDIYAKVREVFDLDEVDKRLEAAKNNG